MIAKTYLKKRLFFDSLLIMRLQEDSTFEKHLSVFDF